MNRQSADIYVLLYLFFLFSQIYPGLVNPDGIGYYVYVRSLFLDGDLNFWNEFKALDIIPPFIYRTSTNLIGNQYPIGSAILWAPFFLLGHLYTWLSPYFYPIPLKPDGYSAFYLIFIALGTSFYGSLGLFLVHEVGKHLFPPRTVVWATLLIIFGTPFFYYLFIHPTLAHINSFFTLSLFLYVWFFTRNNRTLGQWALLGLLAGFAGLVRTQNLLIVLLPFSELLVVRRPLSIVCRHRFVTMDNGQRTTDKVVVLFGSMLFALIPQMLTWKTLYGTVISPIHGLLNLDFREGHLLELLFSPFHGLLFWSPILLLTLPGLYLLTKKDFLLGLTFSIFFLLQMLLNSRVLYWWSGYSFGSRFFVDYTFIFILSLAGFIHWLKMPEGKKAAKGERVKNKGESRNSFLPFAFRLSPLLLASFWNLLLFLQTLLQNLDLNQYIPLYTLLQGQLEALQNLIPAGVQIFFLPKLPLKVLLYVAPVFLFITLALAIVGRAFYIRQGDEYYIESIAHRTKVISIFLGCYLLGFILWLSFAYRHTNPLANHIEVSTTIEDFKNFLRTQAKEIYEDYLQK